MIDKDQSQPLEILFYLFCEARARALSALLVLVSPLQPLRWQRKDGGTARHQPRIEEASQRTTIHHGMWRDIIARMHITVALPVVPVCSSLHSVLKIAGQEHSDRRRPTAGMKQWMAQAADS